ncbi:TPA: hypothetical protein EYP66_19075 [Candidatus Poribacteria bacterium]|nr:hypothetical protein [Candidatus Poribacteria bacterium]
MSNHAGSYMLNDLLSKMVEFGYFKDMNEVENKKFLTMINKLIFYNDCNLGEVFDEKLAKVFNICRYCSKYRLDINDEGYCKECA